MLVSVTAENNQIRVENEGAVIRSIEVLDLLWLNRKKESSAVSRGLGLLLEEGSMSSTSFKIYGLLDEMAFPVPFPK